MTIIDLYKYDTDPEHAVLHDGGTLQTAWEHDDQVAQEMAELGVQSNAEQFGQARQNVQKVAAGSGQLAVAS